MVTVAIIAHRGKAFWGTWMMLVGSIGGILGAITMAVGSYFLFSSISSLSGSGSPSTPDNMALYSLLSGIGSLIWVGCIIAYAAGLLGLAIRYGAISKRVNELETITASLMSEREGSL